MFKVGHLQFLTVTLKLQIPNTKALYQEFVQLVDELNI
jgi:hypothetical protein